MGSKLKILRVYDFAYPRIFPYLIKEDPSFLKLGYEEQKAFYLKKKFFVTNAFENGMRARGYEATELMYYVPPLHKAWLRERNRRFRKDLWQIEAALGQIQEFKPDIVYFQNFGHIPRYVRTKLKEAVPSIRLMLVHLGFPTPPEDLKNIDHVFTTTPLLSEELRKEGHSASVLYHAMDETLLEESESSIPEYSKRNHNTTFIGSSGYGYPFHFERYWFLHDLLSKSPIHAWLDEGIQKRATLQQFIEKPATTLAKEIAYQTPILLPQLRNKAVRKRIGLDQQTPYVLSSLFPKKTSKPAYGHDFYDLLKESKVSLNIHTESAKGQVGNLRLFQATGMGSCLLTDHGPNLSDLFEIDKEVVSFSNTEECIEKIEYLQNNPKTAKEIAEAGHRRTVRDHTISHRCDLVHEKIQELLN
ncbi:glycosyltransferase [Pelagicoccus mobilis]|uniref:Glycosyltransferase family 1 protein n=1 Tax=Pelagicoccus mobilis TaxID=415221 RepID=A0A934VRR3_9BACT|nr:glycosyltransferase [Pelagicoccus mobilis]MBK1878225.1 glycosyltransferase family 1 protein [Pelagicoccus mobilis]